MDRIETLRCSLIQHGPHSDRIYLMKLHDGDVPGILDDLSTLARDRGYSKIFAKVPARHLIHFKEHDYVTASRALGESSSGILRRRVIPNSITPLIVAGSLGIATAVLEVAALSFLGLGIPEPVAEWGAMIGRDFNSIFTRPLLVLSPAFMLTVMVLAFNLLGDGIRDALDPRLNR